MGWRALGSPPAASWGISVGVLPGLHVICPDIPSAKAELGGFAPSQFHLRSGGVTAQYHGARLARGHLPWHKRRAELFQTDVSFISSFKVMLEGASDIC